ncbi:MAG: hypothetical protein J6Z11_11615 [Candidatus Riflebacteria bacterium]|nr:hypothetical protein [Candidatus Riflebacteria bacterium]
MSQFNYQDYQNVVNRAQSAPGQNNAVKVGFFKLKDNGDEALVRFNVGSLDELQFATVHQLSSATKWMKVSCLNEVGSYSDTCPLCKRVADGDTSIGKAAKKVYVQLLVAYKDKTTGQFSNPIPVVWEKPAGFSREIATLLSNYGNLKEHIFKVTRNGAAGDMKTTYNIAFLPLYDKPEIIPVDFSAFNNFKINKHSYWEKTAEEIETFLATGAFPETEKPAKSDGLTTDANGIKHGGAPVFANAAEEAAADAALDPAPAPAAQTAPATGSDRPARDFKNFSF